MLLLPRCLRKEPIRNTGADKLDKVILKGLELFAFHGVNPEEKENGQRFVIDIAAEADVYTLILNLLSDLTDF